MAVEPSPWQSPGVRVLAALAALAVTTVLIVLSQPSSGSGQFNFAAGLGGQHAAGLALPGTDPGGLCRYNYSIKTWSGEEALTCDPAICQGADKLQLMAAPMLKQRRWSSFDEATYLDLLRSRRINGWLQEPQVHYVRAFSEFQHHLGLFGAVGEVGVHHGKFFMPIAGYALRSEPAVAMDLFEDQSANFDQSGHGSTFWLLKHLETVGISEAHVKLIAGNSMFLKAGNVSAHGLPAFRMFSVDGGHSVETTLHDMMLASCLLRDGGIMIVDDVHHPTWHGVAEAMFHFSFANKRMVPLLLGYNKAYFTTASHVEQYRQFIMDNNATFTCRNLHGSRHAMAGNVFCYSGPHT